MLKIIHFHPPHPPEEAGEDVHRAEEDDKELEQPHARRADVEPLRKNADIGYKVALYHITIHFHVLSYLYQSAVRSSACLTG